LTWVEATLVDCNAAD